MKKILYLLILGCSLITFSQNEQKFDSIFSQWKGENVPGVAGGAIHNGRIIYLKGFGSSDLENNVKITPQTKFQVDDLAKQFTVLAILQLEKEGKLSLEDDVRKHITDLPDYKNTLRVKHLLNHSSGLNDLDPIKELLGIKPNDVFTQHDAINLINKQKQLNFIPGTEFSYHTSDTELILLVEIIAKASGKSFKKYTSNHIFKPLSMFNTIFNNERSLMKNTAISYNVGEDTKYNPVNDLTLGVTNLYTSAEDLAKWYLNYSNPEKEIGKLVKKLDNYVILNDGKIFNSSWGKMTYGRYFDHAERGVPKMWQFGLVGGYASNMFRFHTKNFTSFVIGNNNRYNGMPAMEMAYEILENNFTEPPSIDFSKVRTKKLSTKKLKKHRGFYWNKKNGGSVQIYVKNDTLRYKGLRSNRENTLVSLDDNTFQFVVRNDDKIILKFINDKFSVVFGDSDETIYDKFNLVAPTKNKLNNYTGLFYNDELDVTYTFLIENDNLVTKNLKNGSITFYPIINDTFRSNTLMLSSIKFVKNAEDKIIGFTINTNGVKDLYFDKIKP